MDTDTESGASIAVHKWLFEKDFFIIRKAILLSGIFSLVFSWIGLLTRGLSTKICSGSKRNPGQ